MTAVNPAWIDTVSLNAFLVRRVDSLLVMANGANPLGARSGVVPGSGGFAVTVSGTTITVGTGITSLYFAGQGVYRIAMTSTSTLTQAAPHATLPRIDLVYLRVWDNSVDGSGLNQADVVYLAGTAASSPVAPTPSGTVIYMPLAQLNVPASGGGSTTVNSTVLPITVAPGGILPASSAPSNPYIGQYYDNGTDLLRWNGSSWDTYFKVPGSWIPYTPVWTASITNPTLGNGTLIGRYQKVGRDVHFHINLTTGSTSTYGNGGYNFTLPPFMAAANGASMIGTAQLLGTNRWNGQIVVSPSATGTSTFFPASQTDCRLAFHGPTVPEAMANGTQVRITGTYESVS
ncbi:hypothetical protein [Streptomyces mirabilis]|uniref:hypothetical protein n=1 Tax=Streptomyces mirabilis TaxID=68239 RepID=UPI00369D9779